MLVRSLKLKEKRTAKTTIIMCTGTQGRRSWEEQATEPNTKRSTMCPNARFVLRSPCAMEGPLCDQQQPPTSTLSLARNPFPLFPNIFMQATAHRTVMGKTGGVADMGEDAGGTRARRSQFTHHHMEQSNQNGEKGTKPRYASSNRVAVQLRRPSLSFFENEEGTQLIGRSLHLLFSTRRASVTRVRRGFQMTPICGSTRGATLKKKRRGHHISGCPCCQADKNAGLIAGSF